MTGWAALALRTCACPGDTPGASKRTGLGPEHHPCQAPLPWAALGWAGAVLVGMQV